MKKLLIQEIAVAIVFIIAMLLLLTHHNSYMPESLGMYACIGVIVFFLLFAGLVLREQAADERERAHRDEAGRFSFLVGLGIIVVGAVYQTFVSHVDPWLVWALIGMVGTKIASRLFSHVKK